MRGGIAGVRASLIRDQLFAESLQRRLRVSSDFVGDVAERLGSGLQNPI